jgi:hypothetical protein
MAILKCTLYVGAKCNILIMTLIHTICGSHKCNTCMTIQKCTLYMGEKCNTHIMTLIHTIYGRWKCNTWTTIYGCTLYLFIDLWMVGLWRVSHSNQDTQASIESYQGALKRWFSLETKGFRGRRIDWLLWRLTIIVARHYMHTIEMKKCGLNKKKVVEHIVKTSVKKATLIPHTSVTHGIDDSNRIGHAWMVRHQQHTNMTYKVLFPFTTNLQVHWPPRKKRLLEWVT